MEPPEDEKPKRRRGKRAKRSGSRASSPEAEPERLDEPIKDQRTGMVLISKRERRITLIEQWLAEGLKPRSCSAKARAHFGIRGTQADTMVALVMKRLRMDAVHEPPESKRDRIVAQLQEAVRQAFAREDLRSAIRGLHVLSLVEGVIDHSGIADMRARQIVERERESFFASLRGSLDEETWQRVSSAVDAARLRARESEAGTAEQGTDRGDQGETDG